MFAFDLGFAKYNPADFWAKKALLISKEVLNREVFFSKMLNRKFSVGFTQLAIFFKARERIFK